MIARVVTWENDAQYRWDVARWSDGAVSWHLNVFHSEAIDRRAPHAEHWVVRVYFPTETVTVCGRIGNGVQDHDRLAKEAAVNALERVLRAFSDVDRSTGGA